MERYWFDGIQHGSRLPWINVQSNATVDWAVFFSTTRSCCNCENDSYFLFEGNDLSSFSFEQTSQLLCKN